MTCKSPILWVTFPLLDGTGGAFMKGSAGGSRGPDGKGQGCQAKERIIFSSLLFKGALLRASPSGLVATIISQKLSSGCRGIFPSSAAWQGTACC